MGRPKRVFDREKARTMLLSMSVREVARQLGVSRCRTGAVKLSLLSIGAYGPLTRSMATQGVSTQNGIAMVQDKVNKAGGVLGRKIQFIIEDCKMRGIF